MTIIRQHKFGSQAAIIGENTDTPAGMGLLETAIGGNCIIDRVAEPVEDYEVYIR